MSARLHPDDIAAIAAALQAVQPPLPSPAQLLDADGAASLLNVPKSWVLAEARHDRIPHVRMGNYVRFRADELEAWACERARGPRPRSRVG